MKKLMFAVAMTSAFTVVAADAAKSASPSEEKPAEVEAEEAPLIWGFANYGIYSGYQLYGSLLNNEPTLQGYAEGNFNLSVRDVDLGYLGVGVWSNSDLTRRRNDVAGIGDVFNEWDFNIHWGRTFWFDDDEKWGLAYRTSFVWYYYPGKHYQRIQPACDTTWDWNHYFELVNPYVIPYVNVVREYRFDANLFQFGLKKPIEILDNLTLTPFVEMVARDSHYNWNFPTRFGAIDTCGGLATLKIELDANYRITDNFGLFAKIAYCSIIDHHMRNNCDDILSSDEYGENKDFVWGGVGVFVNF